jgi:hypothetical protein
MQSGRTPMTLWRMRIAFWIPKSTNTLTICNTFWFSTAAIVTHKHLEVTLYVHCLSCYIISLSCLRSSNEHRRKGIFSCVYQFNLSITVRHLPNNMEENPVRKTSSLTVGKETAFYATRNFVPFSQKPAFDPYLPMYKSIPFRITYVFRTYQEISGSLCPLVEACIANRVKITNWLWV